MFRAPVRFSPVELDYLKAHIKDPKDQLCIALAKTRSAIDKKIRELKGGPADESKPIAFQSRVGKREDLGIFVRSMMESNVLRVFKSGLTPFTNPQYEPQLFSFTEFVPPKGSSLSYLPDFSVEHSGETKYVEVKGGWLRGPDKVKLKRFFKYYPEEAKKLIAVTPSSKSKTTLFFKELGVTNFLYYNELTKKYSKLIAHWEK
jgi:hypothetical protein